MNAPLLIRAVSILSFFCLAGGAPVSDASDSPHAVANGCLAHVCETPECRLTCDATCLLCHDEQMTPDLSGATAWNSTGAEIAEVYPQQMAAAASSLADSCTRDIMTVVSIIRWTSATPRQAQASPSSSITRTAYTWCAAARANAR